MRFDRLASRDGGGGRGGGEPFRNYEFYGIADADAMDRNLSEIAHTRAVTSIKNPFLPFRSDVTLNFSIAITVRCFYDERESKGG